MGRTACEEYPGKENKLYTCISLSVFFVWYKQKFESPGGQRAPRLNGDTAARELHLVLINQPNYSNEESRVPLLWALLVYRERRANKREQWQLPLVGGGKGMGDNGRCSSPLLLQEGSRAALREPQELLQIRTESGSFSCSALVQVFLQWWKLETCFSAMTMQVLIYSMNLGAEAPRKPQTTTRFINERWEPKLWEAPFIVFYVFVLVPPIVRSQWWLKQIIQV